MKELPVRALMHSPVITVSPTTSLPKLKRIMREQRIRRLPVVSDAGCVGIVTFGDVRSALPSDATTLSIYELSYLLDKLTAADVMRTAVVVIDVDTPVREAAHLMLTQKISGLPVLEHGKLVGIITESDIFRAVVNGQLTLTPTTIGTAQRLPRVPV